MTRDRQKNRDNPLTVLRQAVRIRNVPSFSRLALFLVIGLGAGFCAPPAPILRVGTNVWPGYELLYLARKLSLLNPDIRLVEFTSATAVSHALRSGSVEAGALTLDEVITLRAQGVRLRVPLVLDFSNGADAIMARPGLGKTGWRGLRVSVETTATGALMLDAFMRKHGLRRRDLKITPATPEMHADFYRRGVVDACVTFEPTKEKLVRLGARSIFDSSEIQGQVVDVIAVREELLEAQGQRLRKLATAYFLAERFFRENPGRSAYIMAPRLGLVPADIPRVFRGLRIANLSENQDFLHGPRPRLQEAAGQLAKLMEKEGLIPSGRVGFGKLATGDFLPRALEP